MHIRRIIVVLLYCITVLLTAVKAYSDKRIPEKFKSMVRYGRSSKSSSNERDTKPINVRRGDAFLVGTRFGKRSSWNPNASLVYSVSASPFQKHEPLSCTWVGLSNFYKCRSRKDSLTTMD
ncbi:RYamide neuropeptides [Leptinotarsa decemlineata]|uniref:RYamide neuropeptides n=1 Tax=Leptinotarsa decemlineata TaxID=7539 RepID=UPI000C2517FD|nr:RYamide neuropeptides-like [Leptinotarsa decemlineata]